MNLSHSEQLAIITAAMAAGAVAAVHIFHWFWNGSVAPDPWEADVDAKLEEPETLPLCHRCLAPHAATDDFCPECGASVGDYNNFNPIYAAYWLGDLMRDGTFGRIKRTPSAIAGYILLPLGAPIFGFIYAGIYWAFFLMNLMDDQPAKVNEGNQS